MMLLTTMHISWKRNLMTSSNIVAFKTDSKRADIEEVWPENSAGERATFLSKVLFTYYIIKNDFLFTPNLP